MKRIWINRVNSFKEAEDFDMKYYLSMPASKRLDLVQFLREEYFKINKEVGNEARKGLRRIYKVIKQK